MNNQIGSDIRAMRKGRKLTLQKVADHIGRSTAWVSLVERGSTTPSVNDLGNIAALFDINISYFFRSASRSADEQGLVLRREDPIQIGSVETGLVEELLSPRLDGSFEIIRSTFSPHAESTTLKGGGAREDAGVVIAGNFTLLIDEKVIELRTGDSFHLHGQKYSWRNDHDEPAIVFWVISPVIY